MENLGKSSRATDTTIISTLQGIEDSLDIKGTVEDMNIQVKQNTKHKKFLTQNFQEVQGKVKDQT